MKRILLLGLGRSSNTLIRYFFERANFLNIEIILADKFKNPYLDTFLTHSHFSFFNLDINNTQNRRNLITDSDIVISMLPHGFHILVAKDCILLKKHLITASYVSKEMYSLHEDAKKSGILILNECGLDPGIDHMSAMKIIDSLHNKNAKINSFKSFCGGLISPESNNNPWGYKFTWNPENVVLAGSQGAEYLEEESIKSITYKKLFQNITKVNVPGFGTFESYPNRNSLNYKAKYNLFDAHTIIRGTLREKGFSEAWDVFVQLGFTSKKKGKEIVSKSLFDTYLNKLNNSDINSKMDFLDLFNSEFLAFNYDSPFHYLLNILKNKWKLSSNDKDMIVMQHVFNYSINLNSYELKSSMVVTGDDHVNTAMAKTVGLPIFFACKLLLDKRLDKNGVQIPVSKEIYEPILSGLQKEGISFVNH